MTTKTSPPQTSRPRGRPRGFDPDRALATAQRLFHARGYDAVGIADLTAALGINPPSFYAAFGSKAALYAQALDRYTGLAGVPMGEILLPGRPVGEALAALLEEAARRYAADPAGADPAGADPAGPGPAIAGCLAIEGARCTDPAARQAAGLLVAAGAARIRDYVAARHPEAAGRLADYVVTQMAGLSAMARQGHGRDRLLATARLAAPGIAAALASG
ncbi:TetR family transcriptional regulator [Pseudoroseomonas deserti]|uniref:TetR family transcriptional regulator n=1 Tax=Teichococcus deserti TaxID=1817963 RepID=A0A1V2H2F1_9PROT|nr:helix-turn-helix domain-containing protein [Pseudoroseomonas deserti]ONG53585.1 TetR family transcriptional regulator [Pseudoroseomonas deserti]